MRKRLRKKIEKMREVSRRDSFTFFMTQLRMVQVNANLEVISAAIKRSPTLSSMEKILKEAELNGAWGVRMSEIFENLNRDLKQNRKKKNAHKSSSRVYNITG